MMNTTTPTITKFIPTTILSNKVFSSKGFVYYLREFWDEEGDPRTRDFALMGNGPWTMFIIIVAYLIFVKKLGPELMKNREPFDLRQSMLVYNVSLVLFNAYFFVEALICIRFGLDLLDFEFPDRNDVSPRSMRLLYSGYAYFLTKFLDLFDTVFFVLRKKYSQVIMYSYYALAALGPEMQKYLWWKKYITLLQLYQFVLYGVYYIFFLFLQTGYPAIYVTLGFVQPFIFFYMFYQFFRQSYDNRTKKKQN